MQMIMIKATSMLPKCVRSMYANISNMSNINIAPSLLFLKVQLHGLLRNLGSLPSFEICQVSGVSEVSHRGR